MSAYTEDYVSAQYTTVAVYPNQGSTGVGLAGVQTWQPQFQNPMTVEPAADGKQRARRTGPYRTDFTIRRQCIRGNTFYSILKPPADPAGNPHWAIAVFNMEIDFLEQSSTGITAGSGGWSLQDCWVTNWNISEEDPYGLVYETVTVLALVMAEDSWS